MAPEGNIKTQIKAAAQDTGERIRTRYGIWGLGIISFIESALLVPIITDPFLIAYILANKRDTFRAILVTTLASIIGGIAAYFVAVGFFEVVVSSYIDERTKDRVHEMASGFEEGAFILTFTGALTPIPYTLVAMSAGLVKANFLFFILASLLGRALRYGFEGILVYRFGEPALRIVKKQIVATTILCVIAIVLYVVYKF